MATKSSKTNGSVVEIVSQALLGKSAYKARMEALRAEADRLGTAASGKGKAGYGFVWGASAAHDGTDAIINRLVAAATQPREGVAWLAVFVSKANVFPLGHWTGVKPPKAGKGKGAAKPTAKGGKSGKGTPRKEAGVPVGGTFVGDDGHTYKIVPVKGSDAVVYERVKPTSVVARAKGDLDALADMAAAAAEAEKAEKVARHQRAKAGRKALAGK